MIAASLLAAADYRQDSEAIDGGHLERMTLGDRRLEREVLELFVRQTSHHAQTGLPAPSPASRPRRPIR